MKKILLIMTGGTICSFRDGTGYNAADVGKAAPLLIDVLRESDSTEKNAEFDIISPLDTLSENMSVEKWNTLLDALRKVEWSDYSGVIITHGTDTLHLTAPLVAECMKGSEIPVGIVAAQRPLWDEESNGGDNYIKTVERIAAYNESGPAKEGDSEQGTVFVIYRNSDGISYCHKASELERCSDFSEDFYSRSMRPVDTLIYGKETGNLSEWGEPLLMKMAPLRSTVLMIDPYVGIDYENYNISRVKHILHRVYHSGTANSEKLPEFIRKCEAEGVDFYLAPMPKDYRYSSTYQLILAGAKPLTGMTPWEAYIKLLVRDAVNLS